MLNAVKSVLGDDQRKLWAFVFVAVPTGIFEALAMASMVPIFVALFTGDEAGLWRWMGICGALTAAYMVLYYLQGMRSFDVALSILRNLQRRLGDHVVTLPLGWFTAGRGGLLSLLATKGVMSLANAAAHMMSPVVVGLSASLTVAVIVLTIQWQLGVALLVTIPLIWGLTRLGLTMANTADEHVHHDDTSVNVRLLEFARCQPVLRAAGSASDYVPLADASARYTRTATKLLWMQALGIVIGTASVQVAVSLVISFAAVLAMGGTIDPVEATAVVALCLRFSGPLTSALELLTGIKMGVHNLRRIDEVLAEPPLPESDSPVALESNAAGLSVEFDDVTFSYDDTPVIRDLSATATPGSFTAIVGPSGSGKTTLTKLVARFHDVDSGTVRVGSVDVRDVATADLMANLSLVFQDVYLLDDTLEANIRLGRPDASEMDVRDAAEAAGVLDIAERLPGGWESRVGEGGAALSGGERQRVSIARALLKKAPVVLFDEATAALDPENERHVVESMNRLRESATVLVIAHKLETIIEADTIIMLTHDGRIADHGTHAELSDRCEDYQRYWNTRAAAGGWQLTS